MSLLEGEAWDAQAAHRGAPAAAQRVGGGDRPPGPLAARGDRLRRRGLGANRGRGDPAGGGPGHRVGGRSADRGYRDGVAMRSSSRRRPEQVAETLRQVITEGLARQVRDPRVGFVTVTGVLVTPDLSHARVLVSVPGEDADRSRALEGLQSAAGFLRSRAARVLSTRTVPELHFELDLGLAHAARINELLEGLRREEPS